VILLPAAIAHLGKAIYQRPHMSIGRAHSDGLIRQICRATLSSLAARPP
jgi:hypothetical protein